MRIISSKRFLRLLFALGLAANHTIFSKAGEPPSPSMPIDIVDNAVANPYPSQIQVSGLVGNVSKVTATLTGFSHRYPSDVNVLLVGPGTNAVVLMNKAGGGNPISPTNAVTLTFDMSGSTLIQGSALTTGIYKPANFNQSYNFPPNVPAGPYNTDLSVFNGTQANGTWSLYVVDDSPPDAGNIRSWSLAIEMQPAPTPATMSVTLEDNVLKMTFTGGAGTVYTFQNTTDFVIWTDVATVTADGDGKGSYEVNLAGASAKVFYRTVIK